MTNQEIYDELGQRGIVMISCLTMMASDGDVDRKEAEVIVNIARMLTNNDAAKANELIEKSVAAKKGLKTFDNIIGFVMAGAKLFKELDKDSKSIYLTCLKAVAEADGKIDVAEAELYNALQEIIMGK